MKISTLLFLLVLLNTSAKAQDAKNCISVNGFSLIASFLENFSSNATTKLYSNITTKPYSYAVSYERALNKNLSLRMGIEYGHFFITEMISPSYTYEMHYIGFAFTPEARVYPFTFNEENSQAPMGFFLGAFFKQYFITERYFSKSDDNIFENKGTASGGGIDLGYKFGTDYFAFEPLIGYGNGTQYGLGKDPIVVPKLDGFLWPLIRIELNFGIYF